MRSDRERGVVDSTAWREKHCEEVEKSRVDDARKIVGEADQQKAQLDRERLEEARRLVKEADQPKEQPEQLQTPKGGTTN